MSTPCHAPGSCRAPPLRTNRSAEASQPAHPEHTRRAPLRGGKRDRVSSCTHAARYYYAPIITCLLRAPTERLVVWAWSLPRFRGGSPEPSLADREIRPREITGPAHETRTPNAEGFVLERVSAARVSFRGVSHAHRSTTTDRSLTSNANVMPVSTLTQHQHGEPDSPESVCGGTLVGGEDDDERASEPARVKRVDLSHNSLQWRLARRARRQPLQLPQWLTWRSSGRAERVQWHL